MLDHIIIGQDNYSSICEKPHLASHKANTLNPPLVKQNIEPTLAEKFRAAAGLLLKTLRTQAKLTQQKLFKATGIQQSNISLIETGLREISENEARKLAAVLDIDFRIFLPKKEAA
jgi:DNA-binding XRE family transcriptional regulator